MTEEEALWAAVGANPADSLTRLVLADWYEELAGEVECERCSMKHPGRIYTGKDGMKWIACPHCHGTGRTSNGYAETAAALRATAGLVPMAQPSGQHSWYVTKHAPIQGASVPADIGQHLRAVVDPAWIWWRDYPTAEAAIRDLCAAWVKAHAKSEVQS